jgi:hypothetical protein
MTRLGITDPAIVRKTRIGSSKLKPNRPIIPGKLTSSSRAGLNATLATDIPTVHFYPKFLGMKRAQQGIKAEIPGINPYSSPVSFRKDQVPARVQELWN